MTKKLTACLAIPTYCRPVLQYTLKRIVNQTRLPEQVIVVDSSPNAEEMRRQICENIPELLEVSDFRFLTSEKGSSLQRNIAADITECDIIHYIDDDSLLEPRYIEEMMKVFEADVEGKLGGLEGHAIEGPEAQKVLAAETWHPPGGSNESKQANQPSAFISLSKQLMRRLREPVDRKLSDYVGAWFPQEVLQPQPVPEELSSFNLEPIVSLWGCVMSVRTPIIREYRFNIDMKHIVEDFEATYRIGRDYALCKHRPAVAYHLQAGSGRYNMYLLSFVYLINTAWIGRYCMPQSKMLRDHVLAHHKRSIRSHSINRFIRRGGAAAYRGACDALPWAEKIFDSPENKLAELYRQARSAGAVTAEKYQQ